MAKCKGLTVKVESKYLSTIIIFTDQPVNQKSGDYINTKSHILPPTRKQLYRLLHCRFMALPHLQDGIMISEKTY